MNKSIKVIFTDAYIILLLLSLLLGGIKILSLILYPEEKTAGKMYIRAYNIDTRFRGSLSAGDLLYDSLTKRLVGKITDIYTEHHSEGVDFFIEIDAERVPRGALRCSELWFEWERIDETDFKYR